MFVCLLTAVLLLPPHEPDDALLLAQKRLLLDVQALGVGGRVRVHETQLLAGRGV